MCCRITLLYRLYSMAANSKKKPWETPVNTSAFPRIIATMPSQFITRSCEDFYPISHNHVYEVNNLLAKMRLAEFRPTPDIFSYNTGTLFARAYYAWLSDFKALANVVTTMLAANISGDVVTFSTIRLTKSMKRGCTDLDNYPESHAQTKAFNQTPRYAWIMKKVKLPSKCWASCQTRRTQDA